jgi:hypothetical protein
MSSTRSPTLAAASWLNALTSSGSAVAMWSLKRMYPTVPAAVRTVWTFCTGVSVTLAETMVMVRGAVAPRSSTEKVCEAPVVDGNRPAFSVFTLVVSLALIRSTPSTAST